MMLIKWDTLEKSTVRMVYQLNIFCVGLFHLSSQSCDVRNLSRADSPLVIEQLADGVDLRKVKQWKAERCQSRLRREPEQPVFLTSMGWSAMSCKRGVSVWALPGWEPHTAWPAHWHRTRRRPSTGCPPGGFGPVPQKPAIPSASVGCVPIACAESPWTPGGIQGGIGVTTDGQRRFEKESMGGTKRRNMIGYVV